MKKYITFLILLFIVVKINAQNYGHNYIVQSQTDEGKVVPIVKVINYMFTSEVSIIFKDSNKNILHAKYEQVTDNLGGISYVFYGNDDDKQTIQLFQDEGWYTYHGHYVHLIWSK